MYSREASWGRGGEEATPMLRFESDRKFIRGSDRGTNTSKGPEAEEARCIQGAEQEPW
jgi:hypothetical protein